MKRLKYIHARMRICIYTYQQVNIPQMYTNLIDNYTLKVHSSLYLLSPMLLNIFLSQQQEMKRLLKINTRGSINKKSAIENIFSENFFHKYKLWFLVKTILISQK